RSDGRQAQGLLLACVALKRGGLVARVTNGHAVRLSLLRLRDAHLEHALVEVRLYGVGVDALRQRERAAETAERTLDAVEPALLALLLGLALTRHGEDAVLHLDLDVVLA